EYFEYKNNGNVTGITVTSNIKAGNITLIPEIRFDNKSTAFPSTFVDSNGASTNSAAQFLIAAVYAF
ncbi:MAG: porin, partial [Mucilaginibacter sp.]